MSQMHLHLVFVALSPNYLSISATWKMVWATESFLCYLLLRIVFFVFLISPLRCFFKSQMTSSRVLWQQPASWRAIASLTPWRWKTFSYTSVSLLSYDFFTFLHVLLVRGCKSLELSSLGRHKAFSRSGSTSLSLILLFSERQWNMWIPGFGSDEIRPFKKACTTEAHKQVNGRCCCQMSHWFNFKRRS